MVDVNRIARITSIKDRVTNSFDAGDWETLALYLGESGSIINNHQRLLRSLGWGDPDYPACVAEVIGKLTQRDPDVLDLLESMLKEKGVNATESHQSEADVIANSYVSEIQIDTSQAAVMMPFKPQFEDIRDTLKIACSNRGLTLKAADDIWNNSVLIQDILDLIRESCIIIVDFTGKNPNVMYETGYAHALNKEVIPITQSMEYVPFDLSHHRALVYENNSAGRAKLQKSLEERIKTIQTNHKWSAWSF